VVSRVWLLAVCALSGCGWKSDGLERLERLYPTKLPVIADAGSGPELDLGTPKCSGFDGRWAVRLVQQGTIAPIGEAWGMTVTDLFLADSTAQSFSLRFCDQQVAITTSGGATDLGRSKVSDVLQATLARNPVTLTLPGDGTFSASELVWLWGLKGVANPLTDILPNKDNFAGDVRVWDQDDDGKPGVTLGILAPAGDRYMVRRAVWTFGPGKLTFDNQWISGPLTSAITESGLDATNALLLTAAPITPKAAGTVYQLRCVGPTYSCASLAADQLRLFKEAPR
jgi:hypothetical protein